MAKTEDPYSFLKALLAREEARLQKRPAPARNPPLVVTLSRDYGSGGDEIARQLAETLGIPLHDKKILELAAEKARISPDRFEHREETHSSGIAAFMASIITGSGGELHVYRHALFEAITELARGEGILVGRGAHLVLSGHRAFRIRIVGSSMACAKRIAARQGLTLDAAARKVFEVNQKRHESIEDIFSDRYEHCSLEYAKNFDLVINTDHIDPENAIPVILIGMQKSGFNLDRQQVVPC